LPAGDGAAVCNQPMKILVIDNDSERINTLKSLEFNGHLVQTVAALSEVRELLDGLVCQVLVLGPEQIDRESLKKLSEWRLSLGEKTPPVVVALGPRQDSATGIDHFFPIPFDAIDAVELLGLRGIPPEPEVIDHPAALKNCDDDEDLLREISEIFIKDSPNRIEKLTRGLEEKDWKSVREAAHLMKGSALNLAAGSFLFASQNLERSAKTGNALVNRFWSSQLVYEYWRLKSYLKGLIDGSTNLP